MNEPLSSKKQLDFWADQRSIQGFLTATEPSETMIPDSSSQPALKGQYGSAMKGADVVVEALIREGVDVIFAYPGGASLELHQSLVKREDKIRTILPRFEQGGGFMAHGYARATGKAGVCMATSGP